MACDNGGGLRSLDSRGFSFQCSRPHFPHNAQVSRRDLSVVRQWCKNDGNFTIAFSSVKCVVPSPPFFRFLFGVEATDFLVLVTSSTQGADHAAAAQCRPRVGPYVAAHPRRRASRQCSNAASSSLFITLTGGSGFHLQQVRGQANVTKLSWVFNVDLKLSGWLAPRMGDQVRL